MTMLLLTCVYRFFFKSFLDSNYSGYNDSASNAAFAWNSTVSMATTTKILPEQCVKEDYCLRPENSILFLFLMFSTLWVGQTLLRFDES